MAVFVIAGCAALELARERLGVLNMDFGLESIDVGGLAYPMNAMEVAKDLASFNAAAKGKYGVDVRCRIRASNPGSFAVAFDGASARLRVRDTTGGAPATSGNIPAFRVGAGKDTVVEVVFPLRLDNPVFARAVWNSIIRGESMPYRLDARLSYDLQQAAPGLPASGSLPLDVARGSVNARQTGATALQILLRAVEAAL